MRSKLLLIILFLAIPTAAYAEVWILWAGTTGIEFGSTNLQVAKNEISLATGIHGFNLLELCKVEAEKSADFGQKTAKELYPAGEVFRASKNSYMVTLKIKNGKIRKSTFFWTCYPSNFDPRGKTSQ